MFCNAGFRIAQSLCALSCAWLVCCVTSVRAADAPAQPTVELLWPAGAPGAVGQEDADKPTLSIWRPQRVNGTAIVICPGGGYGGLAVDHEGRQVAEWLNSLGITAAMLKYRLAPRYKHPAPLQDAQRALRTIRARAEELGVSPSRVGILGFSAGGHLSSTLATHFDGGKGDAEDPIERIGCRPDFAVLCYPVITLFPPYAHMGSRNNLIGQSAPEELVKFLSNDLQVTESTPPTFLFHTNEDKGVPPENSVLFYMALRSKNVPAEMHIYEKGGHGVGLAKQDPVLSTWPERCAGWMRGRGLLKIVADDPATVADPDFHIQGEYAGTIKVIDNEVRVGVQVIALGNGMFRSVAYQGGLPGDGWDGSERRSAEAELQEGAVKFQGMIFNGQISTAGEKKGTLTVSDKTGAVIGQLQRVERVSPTIGAPPPAGATVLFDGKTPEQFENGKLTRSGLLAQGVTSKPKFQSCTVHLEFRTPYQPNDGGQGRGNSGCYLQGRYEVQILDSFGLDGKDNECGGIYSIKAPDANLCFPPLAWQTYDIDYTAALYDAAGKKTKNARITVRHNGVVIHRDVELPKTTTAAPVAEGPEPGPLYLQDHGNPVRFRNVWVLPKN